MFLLTSMLVILPRVVGKHWYKFTLFYPPKHKPSRSLGLPMQSMPLEAIAVEKRDILLPTTKKGSLIRFISAF